MKNGSINTAATAGKIPDEHIYESLDIKKLISTSKLPPAPPPTSQKTDLPPPSKCKNDLRLSTEVQCWPWPRQSSLPASATSAAMASTTSPTAAKKGPTASSSTATTSTAASSSTSTSGHNFARSIQSSLRSVSLGRNCDPPPGGSSIGPRGRTLLQ